MNLTNRMMITLLLSSFSVFILAGCKTPQKDRYKGLSEDQIYAQAQQNVKKESFAEAAKDFEALEARYPYGKYSDKAQIGLIHAYYKRNEPALALSTADRFIRMNPRHAEVDYVYYLKGLVGFDQNTTFVYRYLPLDRSARDTTSAQESFDAFKVLLERFPNSKYIPDARKRMVHLREQLASHEYQILEYYVKRGAYLSVANRANHLVKYFSETSYAPKALAEMVIAYRKLGMKPMADEALKTLRSNYPNSDQLKRV